MSTVSETTQQTLHNLADQIDSQAAISSRSGQCADLEAIATRLRNLATPQQMVREFHDSFGVAVNESWTPELADLRVDLLDEECLETTDAILGADLTEIAKELADLVYVAYGTAVSLGIDLDAALVEVHRSNMSKLGPDGKPVLREDGKVLKGPNYRPPNLARAVRGVAL